LTAAAEAGALLARFLAATIAAAARASRRQMHMAAVRVDT